MRTCHSCGIEKPSTDYVKNRNSKNGRSRKCRECLHQLRVTRGPRTSTKYEYYKGRNNRRRARGREFLRTYLETHPCVDCGESDPVVLEFDHVRGVKENNVTTMCRSFGNAKILKEIAKCEVRCANCHRRKTKRNRETLLTYPDTHDTLPVVDEPEPCQKQLIFEMSTVS
jgi:hypothetical protein